MYNLNRSERPTFFFSSSKLHIKTNHSFKFMKNIQKKSEKVCSRERANIVVHEFLALINLQVG